MHCADYISIADRKSIFDNFWSLTWKSQKQVIVRSITVVDIITRRQGAMHNRQSSRAFFLIDKIRVCKKMFVATYDISNKRMDYAMRHKKKAITGFADLEAKRFHITKLLLK